MKIEKGRYSDLDMSRYRSPEMRVIQSNVRTIICASPEPEPTEEEIEPAF